MPSTTIKKLAAKTTSPAGEKQTPWEPGPEERNEMIRVAAYYMAERDGFRGGESDHWAAAEEHVNLMMTLRETQAKLQIIIDTALDAVVLMNDQGVIASWSSNAESVFGWPREEAIGRTMHETIIPRRYRKAHLRGLKQFFATGKSRILNARIEISALHRDGHEFPVELSIVPIKMADKYEFSAFIRDISERKQMEEKVRQLAFYDVLTQLPNRRLLEDRLEQTMATSKRSGCFAALVFLDLDNFKPINDVHGHAVGDLLLIETADRIKSCVREVDTVARIGGDEFVVIISELHADEAVSIAQAKIVAEKIRAAIAEPYRLTIRQERKSAVVIEHRCTASIGVVLFLGHAVNKENILKRADMAMYRAKDMGRNLIRFYDPET